METNKLITKILAQVVFAHKIIMNVESNYFIGLFDYFVL